MTPKSFSYNTLRIITYLAVLSVILLSCEMKENRWETDDPIFLPGPQGSFDEVAVKDPSIIFYQENWHLFYTARSQQEYTTGYVSASTLTDLQLARRHELKLIRGKTPYGCAPQIFYYKPQSKWYLIFQNRDSNYQPAFSTTATISDPQSWSKPKPLLIKDSPEKWIDFWVICDDAKAYLFYTEAHKGVIVRSTQLDAFPEDWSEGNLIFEDVHEAVHIYKVKGREEFHMIYELNEGGLRTFGFARAGNLNGPWERVTDRYATGDQIRNVGNSVKWTEMVSHGEVIRSGYNERMEYEPYGCRWLIQGILKKEAKVSYSALPWKLGIINLIK